jgi:hypothetical protein
MAQIQLDNAKTNKSKNKVLVEDYENSFLEQSVENGLFCKFEDAIFLTPLLMAIIVNY